MEVGEEGDYIPIDTLSPLSCIKMGSDERHFNVSLYAQCADKKALRNGGVGEGVKI